MSAFPENKFGSYFDNLRKMYGEDKDDMANEGINVKFSDKDYLRVFTQKGHKETNIVTIPVTREGLSHLKTFLERLLEENKAKSSTHPYKLLEAFEERLNDVWSLTTTGMSFSVDDQGDI